MKYLGVDFGMRRIGLAVSEGELASPFKILNVRNLQDAVSQVKKEVSDQQIDQVVIGMPDQSKPIDRFIKELSKDGIKVVTMDETLSSVNALHSMIKSGAGKKKRSLLDSEAAAGILQDYLDNR